MSYVPPPPITNKFYRPRLEVWYDKKDRSWQTAWESPTGAGSACTSPYSGWYKVSDGYRIFRSAICFDTTAIPPGSTITAATLHARTGWNQLMPNWENTWFHFLECPPYPDPPNPSVYATLRLATNKLHSFWVTRAYTQAWRDYQIDPAGLAAIKPGGLTFIALRCDRDLLNNAPPPTNLWGAGLWLYTAALPDQTTYLEVTYSPP